jgi:hypothetical protein
MTTVQILMAVFSVVGYAIGHLHAWLSSPVGSDVLNAATQIVQQKQVLAGHAKLQALAAAGAKLAQSLPVVDDLLHAAASGSSTKPGS